MQPRLRASEKRAVERSRVIEFWFARNALQGRGKFVIDAQATPARWPVKSERAWCPADRKCSKESGQDWEFYETGRGVVGPVCALRREKPHPCLSGRGEKMPGAPWK